MVAIGISGYFSFLMAELGVDLPAWMLGAPGTGDGHVVDLFAMLLCLLIAYLLTLGIRTAARFETGVVAINVVVVLVVVVVGFFHVKTANYRPFFPFGVSGAITGAATVFFAVFGYDAMSTAAEESRDARRHLPKAIIGILTVMFTFMLGVTRVWYSMSRDGLLPAWFARLHPERRVPTRVTWIAGAARRSSRACCRSARRPS